MKRLAFRQVQVGEVVLTVKAVGDAEYARGQTVAVSLLGKGLARVPGRPMKSTTLHDP